MKHWSADYIGIPHGEFGFSRQACNCWGLVVLVYREELDIALQTYEGRYASLEEQREIAALVDIERANPVWQRVDHPQPFDVISIRQGRYASHVGIVAAAGSMLHTTAESHARIEAYTTPLWQSRLSGFYRHREMALRGAA